LKIRQCGASEERAKMKTGIFNISSAKFQGKARKVELLSRSK
jgi:hypothetical protein